MRTRLVFASLALLHVVTAEPSFCAPASGEEEGYVLNLTKLVQNNGTIIRRCNRNIRRFQELNPDLEDPVFERKVLAEVGLAPREEPPRTSAEAELVIVCLLGVSLGEHGVDVKETGPAPEELVKAYRKMIDYDLLKRGCATAEAAIEGLKSYFDTYRLCRERYPDAIGGFYYRPDEVTLKAEKVTAQSYILSATHERCNVAFYASSDSAKIERKARSGSFPGAVPTTPLDELLLRMQFYDLPNLENEVPPPAPPAPPCT